MKTDLMRHLAHLASLGFLLPLHAQSIAADWTDSTNPYAMPVMPAANAVVRQSPPDFRWPFIEGAEHYEVRLQCAGQAARTVTARHNWLVLNPPLPAGGCQWSVRYVTKEGPPSDWSQSRRFEVAADATAIALPALAALTPHIVAMPHPRSLPQGEAGIRWRADMRKQRPAALSQIVAMQPLPPLVEPTVTTQAFSADRNQQKLGYDLTRDLGPYLQRLQQKALAAQVLNDASVALEALDLTRRLAQWDPHGASGSQANDQVNREIAWSLALAYDLLYERLTPDERKHVTSAIAARTADMYNAYLGSQRVIERMPYDSHGWVTVGSVATIAALMAGSTPQFNVWLEDSIPYYWQSISPWGGEDGGFANGTAYAVWDIGSSLRFWTILSRATETNWYKKPGIANLEKFFTYFLPPGSPSSLFGDEAESRHSDAWATLSKAYAANTEAPLSRWYAKQQFGEDPINIALLLAPAAAIANSANFPEDTPDSIFLPSIGWAAFHSRLSDRARTSVYFKSSSYGSFSHSHADQNSFVLNDKGEALLIDSGYYDWYGSPHWNQWYTLTRAHNAITFDGGQGQVPHKREASGKVSAFSDDGQIGIISGDATAAYGGAVQRAHRSLVYLRPDRVLVVDTLASRQARRWEWNLHALQRIEELGGNRLRVVRGAASVCVSLLQTPPVDFRQTDQFTVAPDMGVRAAGAGPAAPRQWHGAWIAHNALTEARFVALLDIGCIDSPGEAVSMNGNDIDLVSLGRRIVVGKNGDLTVIPIPSVR